MESNLDPKSVQCPYWGLKLVHLPENVKLPWQTPRDLGRLLWVFRRLEFHRKSQGRESCLHFMFAVQVECNMQAAFMLWASGGMCQAACLVVHTIDLGFHPDPEEAAVSLERVALRVLRNL